MSSSDDLLFAEHVVRAGFLTQDEVAESLSVQSRMEEMGVHESLRNVLVKRGALREADASIVARNAGLRSGGEPIPGYTLEARLGTGAMGSVYKAWQKGMKRHVAIKILRRDLTDDPRQVERLQREAALVGKLNHPNIVRGLDSGESDGMIWFVMELVDGETLRERIHRLGRIAPGEATRITRQIAEALEHAATHGVVHRDVKPGNILVAKDGLPRLTDYGLAKGESDDALTQLDATLGTPQYISPEQAKNPRDADIRSDIYSLGATLYAMLTGHPPFAGETMAATLTKVLYERPKPLSVEAPDAPPALAYVVERMMAKDRRHRYQTPDELLRDLRALEQGKLVVPAGFKGDIGEYVETRRHRRMWLAGVGLVAAATAIAAGVLLWEGHVAEGRRNDKAAHELASLKQRYGPPDTWDGPKIQEMLAEFQRLGDALAGTPAASEALVEEGRWARQAAELNRANQLELRAINEPVDWPRLVADVDQRVRELRDQPDASVAYRQLTKLAGHARDERDRKAAEEAGAVEQAVAGSTIERAAGRYDALAETLRSKYFGDENAASVAGARATASRFRKASEALERAFGEYDRAAVKDGGLARGEFRALEAALDRVGGDAAADETLAKLLASLPPTGSRVRAVAERREELHAKLGAASSDAWERVRRDVQERRDRRDYAGAVSVLDDFAARALDAESDRATQARDELRRLSEDSQSNSRAATDDAVRRFFEAFGRRDYARARETLGALSAVATATPSGADNPALEFMTAGGRLLELTDKLLWSAFRARVAGGAPLERGLRVRGMRFNGVRDVKIDPHGLDFEFEGGPRKSVALEDVELDDVAHYAGLAPTSPERALVLAAARLAEYRLPADPAEGVKLLDAVAPTLEGARGPAELAPIVKRLSKLRDELGDNARSEMKRAEEGAKLQHDAARESYDRLRYDDAWNRLTQLLEVPRYYRTEYVKRNREEITRQLKAAELGRKTSNYAARYPGAQFTQSPDGSGDLFFDFENPALAGADGRKVLGLVEGRLELASRPAVVADRPDLVSGGQTMRVPLVLEHVLAWRPADATGSPRECPMSIDCPFSMRGRISVSFLYRSDAPFFLCVSIGGVTAGVLSADGEPYGGRGVKIWAATDLDRPDRAFEERYRTPFLAKHPEALKKDADRRYFFFEPGRTYRVEFVKDDRKAGFFVDGVLRLEEEWRPSPGSLDGRVVLATFGAGEVDDLHVTGILP